MSRLTEIGGRRVPFARWSFIRMMLGMRHLTRVWQTGDGREAALAAHVEATARPGDLDDAIRVVDEFCYRQKFMINVGDEKGAILDDAIARAQPGLILELGTYCGYSGLRMARAMPEGGRIVSLEFNADNAAIARRIWDHAGLTDQITVVIGTLGDGGATVAALESAHGFAPGALDLAFFDHDKDVYVSDLETLVQRGWLHEGSVVVADNVKFPGAPEYRRHMTTSASWRTTEHETHVEYQSLIKDLVLESVYRG